MEFSHKFHFVSLLEVLWWTSLMFFFSEVPIDPHVFLDFDANGLDWPHARLHWTMVGGFHRFNWTEVLLTNWRFPRTSQPLGVEAIFAAPNIWYFCQDSTVQRVVECLKVCKECIWGEEWCKTFHVCVQLPESLNFFFWAPKSWQLVKHQVSGAFAASQKRGDR